MDSSTRKIVFPLVLTFVASLVITAVILGPGRPEATTPAGDPDATSAGTVDSPTEAESVTVDATIDVSVAVSLRMDAASYTHASAHT